jgi:hypothetical protein
VASCRPDCELIPKKKARYTVDVDSSQYTVNIYIYDNRRWEKLFESYYLSDVYLHDHKPNYLGTRISSYKEIRISSLKATNNDTNALEVEVEKTIREIQKVADDLNNGTGIYISTKEIDEIEEKSVQETVKRAKSRVM